MKILFIIPPYRTTDALVAQLYPMPLGAVILGTILQNKGHEVVIRDFLLPVQKTKCEQPASFQGKFPPPYIHYGETFEKAELWIKEHIKQFDAVGLFLGQCNIYETGFRLGQYIKMFTDKPLVIGGAFASTSTEEAMYGTGADIAVVGEAEDIIEEVFQKAIAGYKGIIQGTIVNIETIPKLNYGLLALDEYPKFNGKRRGVLAVTRGCPFKCKFCSVWTITGRKHRRMSKEKIKESLLNLYNREVMYICFIDDNLFVNVALVNDVIEVITELRKEKFGFNKVCFYVEEGIEVRVVADTDLVSRLKALNFENIALGVETVNSTRLKENNKPYNKEQLEVAIQKCKDAGIQPKAFYVLGLPGDSVESVCMDLIEFGKTGLSVRANNLKLYPKTEITNEFLSNGTIDRHYDWRLSSFYTPDSKTLTYKQIKKLKTYLGTIGFVADTFGIKLFADDFNTMVAKVKEKKFTLIREKDGALTLIGNIFRDTPYRHFLELILIKEGAVGAEAMSTKNMVVAKIASEPINEIQATLVKLLSGKRAEREQLALL